MAEHWAAAMASAMQGLAGGNGSGQGLLFAAVNTASPLTIRVNDQVITKNLYVNPAMVAWAGGGAGAISAELAGLAPHPYQFLTEYHTKYVLKAGDLVIALQVGYSFYILAKVVAV